MQKFIEKSLTILIFVIYFKSLFYTTDIVKTLLQL